MSNVRLESPGATYHLNANAVDGMHLFRDDVDRLAYLELLIDQARRSRWTVLTYTLMSTHFHALLTLQECTLSSGFQRLQSVYARRFNRRHRRRGVLWQKRFHHELVECERHLYEAVRYDALNAPRAKLCDAAEDWPWSFYGAAIGVRGRDPLIDEEELLAHFGGGGDAARRRLRWYVEESDPRERWRQTQVRQASDAAVTTRAGKRPRRGVARSR
jgi:putative transposase